MVFPAVNQEDRTQTQHITKLVLKDVSASNVAPQLVIEQFGKLHSKVIFSVILVEHTEGFGWPLSVLFWTLGYIVVSPVSIYYVDNRNKQTLERPINW